MPLKIGFILFLPFLIIDMVTASILIVHGYDDVTARDDIITIQDYILCSGRWMVPGRRITYQKFRQFPPLA